jgi:hypothetical protein
MRKPILPAAVITVALLTFAVVTAQAAELVRIDTDSMLVAVNDTMHPLSPCDITQSVDPDTLVDGTSVACANAVTTENSWLRRFDLDSDHGMVGYYPVESIDWGIQSVIGALDLIVNVYCLDDGFPFLYSFMTLMDSGTTPVADEVLTFHNTPVGGGCDTATQDLVIELHAEDCNIAGCSQCFIGMNDLGQTGPTYVASASCGLPDPTDLASVGFTNSHLVMFVNADPGCGQPHDGGFPDDGGDVPATMGVGAVALLLVVLGSGAYFLRRRAAG